MTPNIILQSRERCFCVDNNRIGDMHLIRIFTPLHKNSLQLASPQQARSRRAAVGEPEISQ
jgi:hypothetical protein